MDRPEVIERKLFVDDRGYVYGAFDEMDKAGIKRTYVVENHESNFVRAWHGHRRAATFIHVISGVARVAAVRIDDHSDVSVWTISSHKPSLVYIPPGFYNGAQNLVVGTRMLVYSTITLDECKEDDYRAKWQDIHPEIWERNWR